MTDPQTMLASVDARCREALDADVADQPPGRALTSFTETRFGTLVRTATDERDAVALWTHRALLARWRKDYMDPALSWLTSANAVLSQADIRWPSPVLSWALTNARDVLEACPARYRDPLALPVRAAECADEITPEIATLLRWFADRYDLFYSPGFAPAERRRMERLLPPADGDPCRALTDGCPLADRLRVALRPWLALRVVVDLLRHCEELPTGGYDSVLWFRRARELTDTDGDDPTSATVLRVLAETVLTHESAPYLAYRRGRRAVRLVWAEPATVRLVGGAMHAMAALPHDWVDDLLADLAAKEMLVSPVRDGPRALLWWKATAALGYRRTPAAKDHLRRLRDDRYAR